MMIRDSQPDESAESTTEHLLARLSRSYVARILAEALDPRQETLRMTWPFQAEFRIWDLGQLIPFRFEH